MTLQNVFNKIKLFWISKYAAFVKVEKFVQKLILFYEFYQIYNVGSKKETSDPEINHWGKVQFSNL